MSQTSSLGDDLYTGAAEVGKIRTTISLVIACVIGVMLIVFGVYLLFKENKHTTAVTATIVDIMPNGNCTSTIDRNNTQIVSCDVHVTYDYNGKTYVPANVLRTTDGFHSKNGTMTVYIDPLNPIDCSLESKQMDTTAGMIVVGIAVVVIASAILLWWLSQRYKFFAAAEGVGLGANVVMNRSWF